MSAVINRKFHLKVPAYDVDGSLIGSLSYSCVVRVGLDMGSKVLKTAFKIEAFNMAYLHGM